MWYTMVDASPSIMPAENIARQNSWNWCGATDGGSFEILPIYPPLRQKYLSPKRDNPERNHDKRLQ
jgi:hypothetical protein